MSTKPEWQTYCRPEDLTLRKAVTLKCWECMAWKPTTEDLAPMECGVESCPLYTLRPKTRSRPHTLEQKQARSEAYTPEQRDAARQRLAGARKSRTKLVDAEVGGTEDVADAEE